MAQLLTTTVHGVLDPLTGTRSDIRWRSDGTMASSAEQLDSSQRAINGESLWLIPPLYDADAHLNLDVGIRRLDSLRALAGGIAQMNVAVPWELTEALGLAALTAELEAETFPRMIPLLSVSPDADTTGFAAWIKANAARFGNILPRLCKLYSYDLNFDRNIEALWRNDIKPVVWCRTPEDLDHVVGLAGNQPIHLRHATSAAMIATMRRAGAATVQTSPHFLLELQQASETLTVWPPVPGGDARRSLVDGARDEIDMIASDHNPLPFSGPVTGPGLQSQQQMLSALLHLVDHNGWTLPDLLSLARDAPARIFGTPAPDGFLLVDPEAEAIVAPWPGQPPDRAPYAGLTLKGRVLAVSNGTRIVLV